MTGKANDPPFVCGIGIGIKWSAHPNPILYAADIACPRLHILIDADVGPTTTTGAKKFSSIALRRCGGDAAGSAHRTAAVPSSPRQQTIALEDTKTAGDEHRSKALVEPVDVPAAAATEDATASAASVIPNAAGVVLNEMPEPAPAEPHSSGFEAGTEVVGSWVV